MADRLLRRREVEKWCGIATTTLYRLMNNGEFPEPLRITRKSIRWKESAIQAWIESKENKNGSA